MTVQAPAWFTDPERYRWWLPSHRTKEPIDQFRLWRLALERCRSLQSWADLPDEELPPGVDLPPDGSPPLQFVGHVGLPAVEEIPGEQTADAAYQPKDGDRFPYGRPLFLAINLDTPDAVIRAGVERILAQARQSYPDRTVAPGPRPRQGNGHVSRRDLDNWGNARILQIAEIDWWAARQPIKVPDATRFRWVWADLSEDHPWRLQPTRRVHQSRATLARALGLIEPLWAQLEAGWVPEI